MLRTSSNVTTHSNLNNYLQSGKQCFLQYNNSKLKYNIPESVCHALHALGTHHSLTANRTQTGVSTSVLASRIRIKRCLHSFMFLDKQFAYNTVLYLFDLISFLISGNFYPKHPLFRYMQYSVALTLTPTNNGQAWPGGIKAFLQSQTHFQVPDWFTQAYIRINQSND